MPFQQSLLPDWFPTYAETSPLFAPLRHLQAPFAGFQAWPGLRDLQAVLEAWPEPIRTLAGKDLSIVAQDGRPDNFEQHYAPRIYMTGEIQTRTENWHDFFQYLTWFMFPETKAVINSIHIPHARARIETGAQLGARTPIENMLSLFDEGGAVLIASDPELLQLVRDFQWHELFWTRRSELAEKFDCVPFGHAVYEKGLAPYIGMTANCMLLECDQDYFEADQIGRLKWIDQQMAAIFRDGTRYTKPKDLQPFPILGMPGWDKDNEQEAYYLNTQYFRPGRGARRKEAVV